MMRKLLGRRVIHLTGTCPADCGRSAGAGGLYHDYSGFVFFPIAVLAIVGFGNLLSRDWSHAGRGDNPPSGRKEEGAEGAAEEEKGQKPASPVSYDY